MSPSAVSLAAMPAMARRPLAPSRLFADRFNAAIVSVTACSSPLDELDRVGAGREAFQAALHEHVGENRGGGGPVARDLVGLFRDFAQHLRAHVLDRGFRARSRSRC